MLNLHCNKNGKKTYKNIYIYIYYIYKYAITEIRTQEGAAQNPPRCPLGYGGRWN